MWDFQGDLGDNCKNALGHFNPAGVNHGAPGDEVKWSWVEWFCWWRWWWGRWWLCPWTSSSWETKDCCWRWGHQLSKVSKVNNTLMPWHEHGIGSCSSSSSPIPPAQTPPWTSPPPLPIPPAPPRYSSPPPKVRHIGDLGNIDVDDEGIADIKIEDHKVKMRWGLTFCQVQK